MDFLFVHLECAMEDIPHSLLPALAHAPPPQGCCYQECVPYLSVASTRMVPVPVSESAVGIDLGITRFATLSGGTVYNPLDSFRKKEEQLAWEQRKLSRMQKFSNNWINQKRRINTLHRRIANARKDYLHKISTTISHNHAMVVVEDLKVSSMSASARGRDKRGGGGLRVTLSEAMADAPAVDLDLLALDQARIRRGPPSTRAGSVRIAWSRSKTALTVIPISRKGRHRSQTIG